MQTHNNTQTRLIYTDGAAPNNQSHCQAGGIGVAVYSESGELLETFSQRIEATDQAPARVTNVRCEMLAFIKGLGERQQRYCSYGQRHGSERLQRVA